MLIVGRVNEAIDFYRETLDAELIMRYALPHGVIVHAGMKLGDYFRLTQSAVHQFYWIWRLKLLTPWRRAWPYAART